ncbi:CRISPR-associated endonuclease Cas2 [Persicirhabdus sediminis]|uniref:CRISPR-associated endonuclease Cas2 n=1 Tax=Persicirhabdus sediminis TaxID=454144 RepID=A0A8J7MFH2_9BACT|nr:CRISPR-associated endonuclease Cas2 [Persicirhabdus sediminis]MBK1792486.1 CRISPR-associated endonuclease Cas2 [Persicirhabdus sediminis]
MHIITQNACSQPSTKPPTQLKDKLTTTMNLSQDSLRIYNLGNQWQNRVEHHGQKESYDPDGFLGI